VSAFIKLLTKLILTLSSFSGVLYFFVVINQSDIPYLELPSSLRDHIAGFIIKNLFIVTVLVSFSYSSLKLAQLVFKSGETLDASEVKPIESTAMPTYIGLFVIALGLGTDKLGEAFIVLTVLLVLWGLFERVFYFNPIWLFFGYRFYEVRTRHDNTFTLVTKRADLKGAMEFQNLRRINNYTYLEEGQS
jgi:hypothetical protein